MVREGFGKTGIFAHPFIYQMFIENLVPGTSLGTWHTVLDNID